MKNFKHPKGLKKPSKLLLFLLALSSAARAEFLTGNELLNHMTGNVTNQMMAMGYVMGIYDVGTGVKHCPSNGVTAGQVNDMVKVKLQQFPELRNNSADMFVTIALSNTWPCKKGGSL